MYIDCGRQTGLTRQGLVGGRALHHPATERHGEGQQRDRPLDVEEAHDGTRRVARLDRVEPCGSRSQASESTVQSRMLKTEDTARKLSNGVVVVEFCQQTDKRQTGREAVKEYSRAPAK